MLRRTTAINRILKMRARHKVIQGGTNAGKTYAIIPVIIDFAAKTPKRNITVVAQDIPSLKDGALKIFLDVMQDTNRFVATRYNATDRRYTFSNGTIIRFTSFDSVGKAKASGKRTDLFINEANYISWPIADALIGRTTGNIWIDYNPDQEFWAHTERASREDAEAIILTYLDNEALHPNALNDLMIKKARADAGNAYWQNWWRVYGEGLVGQLQGACYPNITVVDRIPAGAELLGYGLDFGYVNDPTALVAIYKMGRNLFFDELIYATGLSNKRIREKAERLGINFSLPTIADNDQKSIDELKGNGRTYWSIKPAEKGPGSIKSGIVLLNDFDLNITKRSVNMITESRKLIWDTDKDGKALNNPKPGNDHAFDAARYFGNYKLNRRRLVG